MASPETPAEPNEGDAHEAVRLALEDLRAADRVMAGVIGSMRSLQRGQVSDLLGGPDTSDGFFGEHARADTFSAAHEMHEAERYLRAAAKRLDDAAEGASVGLRAPGTLEVVFDGVFDLLAVFHTTRNVAAAQRLQSEIRTLFARTRDANPALHERVPVLAEWRDGFIDSAMDELEVATRFRRPQIALVLLGITAAIGLFGWISYTLYRPSPAPILEAVEDGDQAAFEAAVVLVENEAEVYATTKKQLTALGAIQSVRWKKSNGSDGSVTTRYRVTLEQGGAWLVVTWRGDDITGFELVPD